ncbi:hypothetical protein RUM43_008681 [Polyplax serrata]|uniref:Uncharacterized protein n=1 Tax=Polyplax serrata TaxID=468196 RepID=A0AAN8PGD2_POLSC
MELIPVPTGGKWKKENNCSEGTTQKQQIHKSREVNKNNGEGISFLIDENDQDEMVDVRFRQSERSQEEEEEKEPSGWHLCLNESGSGRSTRDAVSRHVGHSICLKKERRRLQTAPHHPTRLYPPQKKYNTRSILNYP